ncbi:uncharacterized protein [Nicotiana sylvestris]|uniref:uncharacterized protein n=1 Tax=Nicotiana sylvestris TaxID=4096 RepID=UPI00388CA4C3
MGETSNITQLVVKPYNYQSSHPIENIIIDPTSGVKTRSQLMNLCAFNAFLSLIEPKNVAEALQDEDWVNAMQDELNQFERSQVWHLVPRHKDISVIVTKWVFKNKLDKNGTVTSKTGGPRLLEHGMNDCPNSCLNMSTREANPKESHLTAVKRILRYLKGITYLCLWYPKGSNFNLVGYADADYAGFLVDRKRTSGMAHFLGSCLASWATKKQNSASLSIVEAEYVVDASCYAQLLWIKQ